MKHIRSLLLTLIFINCCHTTELFAANSPASTSKQLSKITNKINELKRSIHISKEKRVGVINDLKTLDSKIKQLSTELNQLTANIQQQQNIIRQFEQKINQLNVQLVAQQQLLLKQLQASYKLGNYNLIVLLLNQQDPSTISRLLTYYSYINHARATTIESIKLTKQKIEQQQILVQNKLHKLSELQLIQLQQQANLEKNRQARRELAQLLSHQITANTATLKQDEINKHKLEQLLANIGAPNSTSPSPRYPFHLMRNKLTWPTSGKIINQFGQHIAKSELLYSGITILTSPRAPVYAVFPGKVVFADELRGFGLLMIIDHGHGYMTLYAHNQSLLKQRGANVQAGDLIATSGHSGGFTKNGLYFEIRSNGKPLNPLQWLIKKA